MFVIDQPSAPAAPPQWSADGQFWWTGEQWIPASALPPSPGLAAPLTPSVPHVDPVVSTSSGVAVQTVPQQARQEVHGPERSLREGSRHPLFYFGPTAAMAFFTLFPLMAFFRARSFASALGLAVFAGLTYGVYRLGDKRRKETRISLTNRRLGFCVGIVRTRSFELLLPKVESIQVRRDLLGRLLGYGTLVVGGTGGSKEVLSGLIDPEGFRTAAQTAIHEAQAVYR